MGCTPQNIYRWITEKKIQSQKLFGILLVSESELRKIAREVIPRGTPRKIK